MSDKRYQVFISSTLKDLAGHRQKAIYELQTSGFIAVGMEQFSATDEEQFEHIKKEILLSDYYVVITRGRYGTKASDGKSYTEKEYDFAVEHGIPVLAFTYDEKERQKLPESDKDPENHKEFMAFIQKLQTNRIVKIWSDPDKLISDIIVSVFKQTHSKPRIGWVRGDAVMTSKAMNELENLRSENAEMKAKLAEGNEDWKRYLAFKYNLEIKAYSQETEDSIMDIIKIEIDFERVFKILGEILHKEPTEENIKDKIKSHYLEKAKKVDSKYYAVSDEIKLDVYLNNFSAAKLITTSNRMVNINKGDIPMHIDGKRSYNPINEPKTTWKFTDRGRDYYYKSVTLLPENDTTL